MINSAKSLNHTGWECKHYDSPDLKYRNNQNDKLIFRMGRIYNLAMNRFLFGYIHSWKSFYLFEKKILLQCK